jgi:hypothetical protein
MPAGKTYIKIASQTLSSTSASVTFSNLPQNYTDLVIVASARYTSTNAGQGIGIQFNDNTANDYSSTILEGNGSAASSYRVSNTSNGAVGAIANGSQTSYSVVTINVNNYANTTTNKTYVARQSGPSFVQGITGLWRSTAAVTSLKILVSGTATAIASGSTFTIYGIKAA